MGPRVFPDNLVKLVIPETKDLPASLDSPERLGLTVPRELWGLQDPQASLVLSVWPDPLGN